MNGMRRFLATTKDAVQATAQSYSANSAPAAGVVAPASPSEDLSFTPSPVSRNNSNGAPNWPPAANVIDTTTAKPSSPIPVKTPVTSPTYSNGSPGTTTAGLFFRKDPRSAKPVVTRKSTEDDRASSPSVRKPTPPPPFVPPSKSPPPTLTSPSPSFVPREPSPRALPPVVQSATASGSRSTPSPSVPRSRAKPSLNTNDPSWGSASAQINTRDELLISLLASQAAIDSKECEVLSAEEVDDLKKVRFEYSVTRDATYPVFRLRSKHFSKLGLPLFRENATSRQKSAMLLYHCKPYIPTAHHNPPINSTTLIEKSPPQSMNFHVLRIEQQRCRENCLNIEQAF